MRVSEAVLAGEKRAERESVIGWGVFGFLIAIVAIPAAHLRSPKISAALLAEHDDDATTEHFSSGYVRVLKSRQIKAAWAGFGCVFVAWILLLAVGAAQWGSSETQHSYEPQEVLQEAARELSSPLSRPQNVTLAEYARIKEGMNYSQVCRIIGVQGTEISRSSLAGITTVMYSWTNGDYSNMNAMFQNDRLVTKAQFGLD